MMSRKDIDMIVNAINKEKGITPVSRPSKRKRSRKTKIAVAPSNSQKFSDVLDELREVKRELREIKAYVLRCFEIQGAIARNRRPSHAFDIGSYLRDPMAVDDKDFGNDADFLKNIKA